MFILWWTIPLRLLQRTLVKHVSLHQVICFYPGNLIWLTAVSFQPFSSNLIKWTKYRVISRRMVKCRARQAEVSHLPPPSRWHEKISTVINPEHLLARASNLPEDLALNCLLPYLETSDCRMHSITCRQAPVLSKETLWLIIIVEDACRQ